jgi:hypothetical protein
MYEANMITSIALFTALGWLLTAVGVVVWSAEWWSLLGLFLAQGWHMRAQGYDQGLEDSLTVINRLEDQLKNKDSQ